MNIVVRADASAAIGSGHLMRCLALARAFREDGAQVRVLSRGLPDHLRERLIDEGMVPVGLGGHVGTMGVAGAVGLNEPADAADALAALGATPVDWLVVDHYGLDARWERAMRQVARRVLVIDDLANRPHDCDLLLDQNLYADMETRYARLVPTTCRVLVGPRYALLRDEFPRLRGQVTPRQGDVRRILVSFGGADAGNLTGLAVDALTSLRRGGALRDVTVDVVLGAQHPERDALLTACDVHGFVCHVDTSRMADLMAAADLALGAGGSTTWERCCLGVPTLTLVAADNQRRVVDDAADAGLLYVPGASPITVDGLVVHVSAMLDNPRLRGQLSRAGMAAVDGLGVTRVRRAMDGHDIVMRPATSADGGAMLIWRNDDAVRGMSRAGGVIEPREHAAWLARVLQDPERLLLIGERDGRPVGVVRFDIADAEAEVSIYVVPGFAGRGLGPRLLLAAEAWLAEARPDVMMLQAEVLGHNRSSHRLFQTTGYVAQSTQYRKQVSLT